MVIAAVVIVIVSAVTALRGRDRTVVEEASYTCINGMRLDFGTGVILNHRDDSTKLDAGNGEMSFKGYPLILEGGSILLQDSCSLNSIEDDSIYRLDYFTQVENKGDGILLSRRGQEVNDVSGFIYDNRDTYVFLSPAELSFNNKTLSIRPMTIVQVTYMQDIQIFGPGMEPVFEILETEEVMAEFENHKKLNLAMDRFYQVNGTWRLLFLPLDSLQKA